jgi:hypothetical protein
MSIIIRGEPAWDQAVRNVADEEENEEEAAKGSKYIPFALFQL